MFLNILNILCIFFTAQALADDSNEGGTLITPTRMYSSTHMYTPHTYVYTNTYVFSYRYTYVFTHTHVYTYTYVYTHTYVFTHTYAYTHVLIAAPCEILNSNKVAGLECRCDDDHVGKIEWKGSQPKGNCVPLATGR